VHRYVQETVGLLAATASTRRQAMRHIASLADATSAAP
jgi:hypothetical protein